MTPNQLEQPHQNGGRKVAVPGSAFPATAAAPTEACDYRDEFARRLAVGLALDLHDGPLQDLAHLNGQLALLRTHLNEVVPDAIARTQVLGQVDDLEAFLAATSAELRTLAYSLARPPRFVGAFAEALQSDVDAFNSEELRAELDLEGDFDSLSDADRTALQRVVQEALGNVREHSGARRVRIAMAATAAEVRVEIVDDGCGFDVEEALERAARTERLGLLGMTARVHLLGGELSVQSRPGSGTRISIVLPASRDGSGTDGRR